MRKLLLPLILTLMTACFCACSGVTGDPVATSLLVENPNAPTATPGGFVTPAPGATPAQELVEQLPFGEDDEFMGFTPLMRRYYVLRESGEPRSTTKENGDEILHYADYSLRFSKENDDMLLTGVLVDSSRIHLLRGIHLGDSFTEVLDCFYVQENVGESGLIDAAIIYLSDLSRDGVALPPRGVIMFTTATGESTQADLFSHTVEYSYPLSPYDPQMIEREIRDFVFQRHVILRFYFEEEILVKAELRVAPFETFDNPGGTETPIETPQPEETLVPDAAATPQLSPTPVIIQPVS